jgi:ABC-2 type transport system permease protein
MPIYDASYRHYQARAPRHHQRFWPVAREALHQVAARRALIVLLLCAWLPLLYPIARLFAATRMPELAGMLAIDARLFGNFLALQAYFALLAMLFAGAGLIAEDLRTGGVLVYLSRALSPRDYIVGKLAAAAALNLSITLAPAAVLYLAALALAPDRFLRWDQAWLPPAIAALALLMSAVMSALTLAISSLTSRTWMAGLALFALVTGLDLTQAVLDRSMGLEAAVLLSPLGALRLLGNALFDNTGQSAVHWAWALLTIVGETRVSSRVAVMRRSPRHARVDAARRARPRSRQRS